MRGSRKVPSGGHDSAGWMSSFQGPWLDGLGCSLYSAKYWIMLRQRRTVACIWSPGRRGASGETGLGAGFFVPRMPDPSRHLGANGSVELRGAEMGQEPRPTSSLATSLEGLAVPSVSPPVADWQNEPNGMSHLEANTSLAPPVTILLNPACTALTRDAHRGHWRACAPSSPYSFPGAPIPLSRPLTLGSNERSLAKPGPYPRGRAMGDGVGTFAVATLVVSESAWGACLSSARS